MRKVITDEQIARYQLHTYENQFTRDIGCLYPVKQVGVIRLLTLDFDWTLSIISWFSFLYEVEGEIDLMLNVSKCGVEDVHFSHFENSLFILVKLRQMKTVVKALVNEHTCV